VTGFDHVVLNVASYTVLRTKQGAKVNRSMLVKEIGGVTKLMVNRSLIANQTNPHVGDQISPILK
jgi:hypothetical protein